MANTFNTGGYNSPIIYKNKAVSNTPILIQGSQCNLLGWRITNPNSTTAYFKFFNVATLTDMTLGTTEPVKEFSVPAMGEIFVYIQHGTSHYYFDRGLAIAAVGGLATSSTSQMIINIDVEIYYK